MQVTVRPKWRRIRNIDKISSLIIGALSKRGLAEHALGSLALHRVNGWLNQQFPSASDAAKALSVKDGVLTIGCVHSVVLQELQQRLPDLKQFLAAECPFAVVREIRLARSMEEPGNALAP